MVVLAEGLLKAYRDFKRVSITLKGDTMLLKALDMMLKLTDEELEVLVWHINALLMKDERNTDD